MCARLALRFCRLSKENVDGESITSICGTPEYLAPEILKKLPYGASVDWYGARFRFACSLSLSCVFSASCVSLLLQVVTRHGVVRDDRRPAAIFRPKPPGTRCRHVSRKCSGVVLWSAMRNALLALQAMYRKILEADLEPPSFMSRNAVDLCQRLLVRDPAARLGYTPEGVEEFKRHPFFEGLDWYALERKEVRWASRCALTAARTFQREAGVHRCAAAP
jgi:serine/threonine protein kinase